MRRLQPFPQTAGNQAALHEADFRVRWCDDRERAVRGQSPATAPVARACGTINDRGMIKRGVRLNEVAMNPTPDSASADLQQTIADLQHPLSETRAERDESEAQKAALTEVLVVINSSPGDLASVFDSVPE